MMPVPEKNKANTFYTQCCSQCGTLTRKKLGQNILHLMLLPVWYTVLGVDPNMDMQVGGETQRKEETAS